MDHDGATVHAGIPGVTQAVYGDAPVTAGCATVTCDVVLVLAGVLQCNGGKLEEAEDFECVFIVNCVLESK